MAFDSAEPPSPPPLRIAKRMWADRDWMFALSLALAVGVVVWFGRAIHDFFGPSAQTVLLPAYVGQTKADASAECERLRLKCAAVATQPSDRYPKDVVMNQQPAPGTRVREGRQISLIISSGVTIFAMPDMRFESLRNASLDLNRLKLDLTKTTTVPSDEAPANFVVGQDPPPMASVRQGTKVTLQLSAGAPNDLKVPNFTGMDIDSARSAAGRAKVKLGQVVWTPFGPNGPRRGEVVHQRPGAGATVDAFEPVSLQVSAGPGEYGYLVRQAHVSATVPASNDSARVRIEVRDDTGTWNVYDAYAQGGQKLDFTVTAIGSAEVDTYINNELLNQTRIGTEPPREYVRPQPEKKK